MKVNNILDDPNEWRKAMNQAASMFFDIVDDEHFKIAAEGRRPGKDRAMAVCPHRMIKKSPKILTGTNEPTDSA